MHTRARPACKMKCRTATDKTYTLSAIPRAPDAFHTLYAMQELRFFNLYQEDQRSVKAELAQGLQAAQAVTSPKYLYDALGSRLFDAITELPEYYPTRTEAAIFDAQRAAIAAVLPKGAAWVDLGAGSCQKAAGWFAAARPARYVAVDISVDYLRNTLRNLQQQHPGIAMAGVGMDFSTSLGLPIKLLADMTEQPIVAFYPGSSIGNFTPSEAQAFLQRIHALCKQGSAGGGVLIGVDLVKATGVLEAAYDDAIGVTAAFNLNMLRHINTLLGTDFEVRQWQHVALFNTVDSRIEMHVQARKALTVRWSEGDRVIERKFAQNERIHTENSYKWTLPGFSQLLANAGFASSQVWTDAQAQFAVFWAAA